VKTKIKICGITNTEDALLCEESGADALGFIFYEQSKRYITPERASLIISELKPLTTPVGVFVNHSPAEIEKICIATGIRTVQLHGDYPDAAIEQLTFPVIKTFRIGADFDFSTVRQTRSYTPLFDTFAADLYGGTGVSYDYTIIPEKLRSSSIIAGGISVENVEDVLKLRPYGIDLVSSLEQMPGKKDVKKVKEFFLKVKYSRQRYDGIDET